MQISKRKYSSNKSLKSKGFCKVSPSLGSLRTRTKVVGRIETRLSLSDGDDASYAIRIVRGSQDTEDDSLYGPNWWWMHDNTRFFWFLNAITESSEHLSASLDVLSAKTEILSKRTGFVREKTHQDTKLHLSSCSRIRTHIGKRDRKECPPFHDIPEGRLILFRGYIWPLRHV